MSNNYRGRGRGGFWRGRGGYRGAWKRGSTKSNSSNTGNDASSASGSSTPLLTDNPITTSVRPPDNQPLISVILDVIPGPYPGWKLYHPLEAYMEGSPTANKIKAMEGHIARKGPVYNRHRCRQALWYPVHLHVLENDTVFIDEWPMFNDDLLESPEHTLDCLGLAMHQILSTEISLTQAESDNPPPELGVIRARIQRHEPITPLKDLKVNSYGKLATVRGTVIRSGSSKLLCSWLAFSCTHCHAQQAIKQPAGVMTVPTSCSSRECRSRSSFTPLLDSTHTQTVTWQTIKLQESISGEQFEPGRVPRSIDVELTADLVDVCCPGDDITVTGIVQVRACDEGGFKKGQPSMFKLYLQAVSVRNRKEQAKEEELTERDYQAINAIQKEPQLFRLLVHSLCPTIYGHEVVKAGLILGLFGGSEKPKGGRKEAHVLVVGDPGLGKSQMLQACSNVAPRGVFVCGNNSSSAGLTVTVRQEGGGGLEAGALVLADQGACCIDEFDKMSAHHQSLLEAMEQQSISVAKAGVVCTLPARTAILAAANPAGGHYDRSKTVAENLKIGPALLSRFDLVFILLDLPDEHLDSLLSEHVLALHSGSKKLLNSSLDTSSSSMYSPSGIADSIKERLKIQPGEVIDYLPHTLMRKYIGYAKKNINPKLTQEAATELQNFYLNLRKVHQSADSTPITTRQLEALVRLTQARARVELNEQATLEHANDVLDIMKNSLVDVFSDGLGVVDFKRGVNGSGMSQASQAKKFINLLNKRANVQCRSVFSVSELKEVAAIGGMTENFQNLLESLNIQGYLLKKGSQLYKLLTVDY